MNIIIHMRKYLIGLNLPLLFYMNALSVFYFIKKFDEGIKEMNEKDKK